MNVIDFVAIDFETATATRHSPCEIGLTFVENNEVKETLSRLIKPHSYPYFDPFNISIHGIRADDVKDSPEFPEVWEELLPLLTGRFIVAHNASFDFSVLRQTLDVYGMRFPNLTYGCTCVFARKTWLGLPNYGLQTLCEYHKIALNHHRAGPDSKATAELALLLFASIGVASVDEISSKIHVTLGRCFDGGYSRCGNIKPPRTQYSPPLSAKDFVGDPCKHNPESIFFEKTVAFTGTLSSMKRSAAFQLLVDVGGFLSNDVTKKTDYLVVGQQDFRIVGQSGMSSKQKKAIGIIEQGGLVEILSEEDFLQNI